ncbi:hypothetical protein CERSUDRAFT_93516 [Gelatoporia subvermispora B]|uniref:Uncharacterized protein n=1 Tax=Ceriporiopsis subvermispora (strain B) TaxID=914234 RepID=M2RGS3_CERS8|nr:hypothetical protein CERSUDRAFT_93516 [Gelatoporia subvermispora B]
MPDSPSSSSAESSRDSSSSIPPPLASSTRSSSTSLSLECSASRTPSILRTASACTLPERGNGSVRFAPLPAIEPRRRKSSVQLGVAARSRMLRQRRMLREQGELLQAHPDAAGWGTEEGEVHFHQEDVRHAHDGRDPDADEEEGEDPLVIRRRRRPDPTEEALASLGKLMKGAGKSLWRRVSAKDKRKDKSHSASSEQDADGARDEKESAAMNEKEREEAAEQVSDARDCVEVAVNVQEVDADQSGEEGEDAHALPRSRSNSGTQSPADAHSCREQVATLQTTPSPPVVEAQ